MHGCSCSADAPMDELLGLQLPPCYSLGPQKSLRIALSPLLKLCKSLKQHSKLQVPKEDKEHLDVSLA